LHRVSPFPGEASWRPTTIDKATLGRFQTIALSINRVAMAHHGLILRQDLAAGSSMLVIKVLLLDT